MGEKLKRRQPETFKSIVRVQNIPIVEVGLKTAYTFYDRLKGSNGLINWYFSTIESVGAEAFETFKPVAQLANGPLQRIDDAVCKGLDFVEKQAPAVYLPPEMIYYNTKEYVSDSLKPVFDRAYTVKKIGHEIMESPVQFAAEKADLALDKADSVIDKYLPDAAQDEADNSTADNEAAGKVIHAISHGRKVSKKLKRRLTMRTMKEVDAFKKQGKEAVNIMIYAAELIVTNPKEALNQAKELWAYLSGPEPENQARPGTIEELIMLLTRESVRRVVHVVNGVASWASEIPKGIQTIAHELFPYTLVASLQANLNPDTLKDKAATNTRLAITYFHTKSNELQNLANVTLERIAVFLSGRLEANQISTNHRRFSRRPITANNRESRAEMNGGY